MKSGSGRRPRAAPPCASSEVSVSKTDGKTSGWAAIGSVVIGAIHLRKEQPCQDALYLSPANSDYAIACVADGHGSASCPYSDEGAAAAVKIAGELLQTMLPNLSDHKDVWLPKKLVAMWQEAVQKIHEENGREMTDPFPYTLYGTTLLALAATNSFVFALQIGDGNILMIDADGTARPVLAEAESVGEDTESLCLADAWKYIRTQIIPWTPKKGAPMFMLSTDGYANGFTNNAGFLKAGSDIFNIRQTEGLDYIGNELPAWLRQSSDKGSGDDIALALVTYKNEV